MPQQTGVLVVLIIIKRLRKKDIIIGQNITTTQIIIVENLQVKFITLTFVSLNQTTMKEIKMFPFILSILGLIASGFCMGATLTEKNNPMTTELLWIVGFMLIAFIFILIMSIGLFPYDKKETKIVM